MQDFIRYENPSVPEIEKAIRREAMDLYIGDKLTPHQKSSITRTWLGGKDKIEIEGEGIAARKVKIKSRYKGLKKFAEQIDRGVFAFVKVKNPRRKKRYENYSTTNKGVFIQSDNQTAKEVGTGKDSYIELTEIDYEPTQFITSKITKKKIPIPPPRQVLFPLEYGINIREYVEDLLRIHRPNSTKFYLRGYYSNEEIIGGYDSLDFLGYAFDYIEHQQNEGKGHPYSGILFIWY
ncbi:hypothetical protein JKY72_07020 [Candidatus Gracilibacteria bacterium]|nr:hypothetical protein [Candidatus Gracilibacteria bacterium]